MIRRAESEASETHHVRVVRRLASTVNVEWVERQVLKKRLFKRGAIPSEARAPENDGLSPRAPAPAPPIRVKEIMNRLGIHDPGFPNQWHLLNSDQPGNDLNLTGVWEQGITGRNTTVCFIDDGLDYESEDLAGNFYAAGSWDYNARPQRALPKPTMADDRHGTRCAGEVAAVRNNVCGVGIAWDAKVSGVRILGGELTEADEAKAINYDFQNNHIYSCSWGPSDNGQAMEAPPKIVSDAVYNGIENGRGGLGSIFVFASGNGGGAQDNCNFDGYTNSIYTITVGAIDRYNNHPAYSEQCSATLIVMYSSGGGGGIYTTDWPAQCTDKHGGTSAAAPLASGLYSLVLSIRPDLGWRDFQHLSVQTAVPIHLEDPDWTSVAFDRQFNHKFGFGRLDGYRLIEAAKTFKRVGPQTRLKTDVVHIGQAIPQDKNGIQTSINLTSADFRNVSLKRLEHVTVTVSIDHSRRGDVEAFLTSPNGVVSKLAARRSYDSHTTGFKNWTFMSVKHWEEHPVGTWTLTITDEANLDKTGTLQYWWMTFWGESGDVSIPSSAPP
ncbi:peptidase S8/S53 domain-containing protein, partial [Blyttiomyces helicus]